MVKTGIKLLIFCVEVVKSERKLGHVVQNFRLPFGVNVNLNLSLVSVITYVQLISNSVWMDA